MSIYYPQGAITLKVRWEDFGTGEPSLNETYDLRILARNLTVEVNDYTEADTFSAEIDYKSFPFDPRNIRSCGITIHIEDRERIFNGNNLDLLTPSEENIVFAGFVDEESISFDDNSRIVRLEGRDFTSLLLDVKRIIPQPLPMTLPVDVVILNLLKEQKATEEIEIDIRIDEILPTLAEIAPDLNPISGSKNPKKNESYWDIIQTILERAALIGYIDLDKLVISKPRALFSREKVKQFIYGKNLTSLSYSRKLGRQKGFNVKVTSLNLNTKKDPLLTALLPKEGKTPEFVSRYGGQEITIEQLDKDGKKIEPPKVADYLVFRVPDIANKDHLIEIGEKIFEEISRQEIEGSLSTMEMLIPEQIDKDNRQRTNPVKFKDIRMGTPIQIYMDQDDMAKIKTISDFAQRKKMLILNGFRSDIADALASSMNKISTPFYTKSVTYNLSQDEGFEMKIDFINYIELDNKSLGK